jgi:hypothetical protein
LETCPKHNPLLKREDVLDGQDDVESEIGVGLRLGIVEK